MALSLGPWTRRCWPIFALVIGIVFIFLVAPAVIDLIAGSGSSSYTSIINLKQEILKELNIDLSANVEQVRMCYY